MGEVKQDVIVIGSGVVGVTCGLALQRAGFNVIILERKSVAAEASQGNAGGFAFSAITPMAHPGIIWKAPKWLLDPMGPLSIPPAYALKVLPWMLRFWKASWASNFKASAKAQASLMEFCADQLDAHLKDVDAVHMLRREGQLQVFESKRQWEASKPDWDLWEQYGVEFEHLLSPEKISKHQPGLSKRFTHATFTPKWYNISDPKVYTHHLADLFVKRGGKITFENAVRLESYDDHVTVETDTQVHKSGCVVVAAGSWSHELAQTLGDNIPLETERGYNTTLPTDSVDIKMHVSFPDHGFGVSKIGQGIRVGGAVELGGLKRAPDYRRSKAMLKKAKKFFPELNDSGGTQWMGFRPSMPDSLPVISRSPNAKNVIYAFGHGHLGLTQSVGTAALVTELINGSTSSIELKPFRANRF